MLVSIIINNFNYAPFLVDAIESALAQDYPQVEVIVVDDGSTDHSRQIITSYGQRITPIFTENGGQGNAFNVGFSNARGELICFLDSDDLFLSNKVSLVAQTFKRNPTASLIYHRIQLVDVHKKIRGKPWPPRVLSGRIEQKVVRSGGWWPRPTTSGLCASRAFLEKVFPLSTENNKLCADGFIAGLAPFFGPVIGLKDVLAHYRLHDSSYWSLRHCTVKQVCERRLERLIVEFNQVSDFLCRRALIHSAMSLEDNLRYQQWSYAAGRSTSRLKAVRAVFLAQTLPFSMKMREILYPMQWPATSAVILPSFNWLPQRPWQQTTGEPTALEIIKV